MTRWACSWPASRAPAPPRSRARGGPGPRGVGDVDEVRRRSPPRRPAARASAPGRSATRVSSTSRRPTSVSWRRAIEASRPGSTLPPDSTATVVPRRGLATCPPSSAATPTAPAPSTTSLQRSISSTIASAVSSSPPRPPSRRPTARAAAGQLARRLDGDPVGDRQRGVGDLARRDLDLGRADFTAIATPLHSPPPPTGMTTRARSGRPRAARGRGCPARRPRRGRRTGARSEPALARPLLGEEDALVDRPPPMWTIAPWSRAASVLAIGASRGRRPRSARPACAPRPPAPARGCPPRPRPHPRRSPARRAR